MNVCFSCAIDLMYILCYEHTFFSVWLICFVHFLFLLYLVDMEINSFVITYFRFFNVSLAAGAAADIMGSGLIPLGVRYDFAELFLCYLLVFCILETIVLEHEN